MILTAAPEISAFRKLGKVIMQTDLLTRLTITGGAFVFSLGVATSQTFTDANWITLGSGMNDAVYALAISGSNVYAGGKFTTAGGTTVNRIARWNGSTWSALGSGMNDWVFALAVSGSNLYAGGFFTTAGGTPANRIAKWNGSTWSALGTGISGGSLPYVEALAVSGTNLFVGGTFTTASFSSANNIARWNGITWSAMGSGMNNSVHALTIFGGQLYAGGSFNTAGSTANYIARWDGSSWAPLGTGMGGIPYSSGGSPVYAMTVAGSNLYAGGLFTSAGSVGANSIARWSGSSWSALGLGVDAGASRLPSVYCLCANGNEVFAGGDFTNAFKQAIATPCNRIVKWDESWSPLGSGMNASVRALTASDGNLYVGGSFTNAGGNAVGYVARGILNERAILSFRSDRPASNSTTLVFAGIPSNSYTVEFSTNLSTNLWHPFSTNLVPASGRATVLDTTATNDQRFYRIGAP